MKDRYVSSAMKNGFLGKCPDCGQGKMFRGFLKTNERCSYCELELHLHRADDFPPYIVIFIVGHIVVAGVLHTETHWDISATTHLMIWIPVALGLALGLLQPVKGAVVGLQWALKMHGFDDEKN